mmetsp:Transcript_18259/g.47699  ORF Transcript_18259/g.47699 Transcript_18259/m.47699 type:complete len:254 (+) Transcript_18259:901-1662(+)
MHSPISAHHVQLTLLSSQPGTSSGVPATISLLYKIRRPSSSVLIGGGRRGSPWTAVPLAEVAGIPPAADRGRDSRGSPDSNATWGSSSIALNHRSKSEAVAETSLSKADRWAWSSSSRALTIFSSASMSWSCSTEVDGSQAVHSQPAAPPQNPVADGPVGGGFQSSQKIRPAHSTASAIDRSMVQRWCQQPPTPVRLLLARLRRGLRSTLPDAGDSTSSLRRCRLAEHSAFGARDMWGAGWFDGSTQTLADQL